MEEEIDIKEQNFFNELLKFLFFNDDQSNFNEIFKFVRE